MLHKPRCFTLTTSAEQKSKTKRNIKAKKLKKNILIVGIRIGGEEFILLLSLLLYLLLLLLLLLLFSSSSLWLCLFD